MENMQDWPDLDEARPGFQHLIEEDIAAVKFFFIFIITAHIIKYSMYSFPKLLWPLGICFLY
jgi:hypothetical protein